MRSFIPTVIRRAGKKGRGVFAGQKIQSGTVIEICPVLVISRKEWKYLKNTRLANYVFHWKSGSSGLALGYGSLYNHSENPNCEVFWYDGEDTLSYVTVRTIKKGEEICFNYGYKPKGYTADLDSGL